MALNDGYAMTEESIDEEMAQFLERWQMLNKPNMVGNLGQFKVAPEVEFTPQKGMKVVKGKSSPRQPPGGIGPVKATTGAQAALQIPKVGITDINPAVMFSGEFKNYAKFLGGKAGQLAKSPTGIVIGGGLLGALASNWIGKEAQKEESKWLASTAAGASTADPSMFTQELDVAIERAKGKKPANLAQRVKRDYRSKLTATKARGAGLSSKAQRRSAEQALPMVRETLATLDRAEKQLVRNSQIDVLDSIATKGQIQGKIARDSARSMQAQSLASAKRVQETIDKWNAAINGVAKIVAATISMGSSSLLEQGLGALQGIEGIGDLTDSIG